MFQHMGHLISLLQIKKAVGGHHGPEFGKKSKIETA